MSRLKKAVTAGWRAVCNKTGKRHVQSISRYIDIYTTNSLDNLDADSCQERQATKTAKSRINDQNHIDITTRKSCLAYLSNEARSFPRASKAYAPLKLFVCWCCWCHRHCQASKRHGARKCQKLSPSPGKATLGFTGTQKQHCTNRITS